MKYKYIIWDWNGTLLDDAALSVEVFNKMCDNFGLPNISLETYRADFKFPVIKFYEEHGYDFSKSISRKSGTFTSPNTTSADLNANCKRARTRRCRSFKSRVADRAYCRHTNRIFC